RGANFGGDQGTALHWHYDHDGNGNNTLVSDPKGQQTVMGYDHLDRVQSVLYLGATDPGLDFQPIDVTYEYDGNGNTRTVTERKRVGGVVVTEVCAYDYDLLDRLTSATNYDHKAVTYGYDDQGNRTSMTDPDGVTTTYDYDERNRLHLVTTE